MMNRKKYHKENFFKHTYCVFDERNFDEIKDIQHNYISQSGSKYIFLPEGLYRISNHWGRVANCRWRLNSLDKKSQELKLGFALWDNFFPNNDNQKLFYIAFDENMQTYTFKHICEATPNESYVSRTSAEAAKVLKDIKEVCESVIWAKYLKVDNFETLKQNVIHDLIYTNQSFIQIKRNYL